MCYRTACLESRNKTKPDQKDNARRKVQSSWHPVSRKQESHASARSCSFPLALEPSCPVCPSSYFYLPSLPPTGLIFSMLFSFISPFLSVPILVSSVSKGNCQSSKPMLNLHSLRLASQLQHFQSSSSGNPVIPWLRGFLPLTIPLIPLQSLCARALMGNIYCLSGFHLLWASQFPSLLPRDKAAKKSHPQPQKIKIKIKNTASLSSQKSLCTPDLSLHPK